MGEEFKKNYVLMKDFSRFMYDYRLYGERKYLCRYCLQAFRTTETLKCHIKDCLIVNKGLRYQKR